MITSIVPDDETAYRSFGTSVQPHQETTSQPCTKIAHDTATIIIITPKSSAVIPLNSNSLTNSTTSPRSPSPPSPYLYTNLRPLTHGTKPNQRPERQSATAHSLTLLQARARARQQQQQHSRTHSRQSPMHARRCYVCPRPARSRSQFSLELRRIVFSKN